MLSSMPHTSVGFQFVTPIPMLMLKGIGWQRVTSQDYIWNGRNRPGEYCLFQYTISGQGEIEIQGTTYTLKPGDAFIVDIPGEHCYCLPSSSEEWELLYLELSKDALPYWRQLLTMSAPVFQVSSDSELMKLGWQIYEMAARDEMNDVYQCSSFAYQFVMELSKYVTKQRSKPLPPKIERCKKFIEMHYAEPIGLKEMAEVAGISKFHLTRDYESRLGVTPVRYLNEVRLTHAVKLLLSTNDNLETIARRTGFSNANYFGKVFRKHMGIPPAAYRENNSTYDIGRVFF
ncbi:AraC family transcriptional regulator [Paenibacillus sediminis]|uniref:AraC-like DNA-binding protein n=1 Tax=Paenibacillus sediminis TaxID=664909 RepID=A0ABS4H3X3_9BACL|nr:AraC family transcriptional regulator [Paenibacillus sediminis]MBP1937230.1 AraC-like DNA-binding protein [Paenibacillus sediminis]